jgi:clan AA aspartic protease
VNGHVDGSGRALVRVQLKAAPHAGAVELDAWIDTGFTGELVLPESIIDSLNLSQSGTVSAELANGEAVIMATYTSFIDWFSAEHQIEVVANQGKIPLLGVGLLRGRRLTVDYAKLTLTIE